MRRSLLAAMVLVGAASPAPAQNLSPQIAAQSVPVTPDNFNRAEADMYWGTIVKDGGFGKFVHHRDLYPIDAPIVRPNRDTLYSMSVFDFDAGPVTVTLPDAGKRFMSFVAINGEQGQAPRKVIAELL